MRVCKFLMSIFANSVDNLALVRLIGEYLFVPDVSLLISYLIPFH